MKREKEREGERNTIFQSQRCQITPHHKPDMICETTNQPLNSLMVSQRHVPRLRKHVPQRRDRRGKEILATVRVDKLRHQIQRLRDVVCKRPAHLSRPAAVLANDGVEAGALAREIRVVCPSCDDDGRDQTSVRARLNSSYHIFSSGSSQTHTWHSHVQ